MPVNPPCYLHGLPQYLLHRRCVWFLHFHWQSFFLKLGTPYSNGVQSLPNVISSGPGTFHPRPPWCSRWPSCTTSFVSLCVLSCQLVSDDYVKVVGNWSWKLLLFCNPWMTRDMLGGQNMTMIGKALHARTCVCVCVCARARVSVHPSSILEGWPCTLSFTVTNQGSTTMSSWYCF